jgi:uncharacterized membrane protein YqaE (UPF0057 family)
LKYIEIVFAILLAIVGVLHITGVWENMPIMLLILSLVSIFNARRSYNNNRKVEVVILCIAAILNGLGAICMLLQ